MGDYEYLFLYSKPIAGDVFVIGIVLDIFLPIQNKE